MKDHPLKTFRKASQITQKQLASLLGVSYATINHIENGRRQITARRAKEWAKKISLSKEDLCPEVFREDSACGTKKEAA